MSLHLTAFVVLAGLLTQVVMAQEKRPRAALETGSERKLGVVYKTVGEQKLEFDLYYPETGTKKQCPVIFYTHGGGWAAGSRFNAANGLFGPLIRQFFIEALTVLPFSRH